jgi:hypothetical protein
MGGVLGEATAWFTLSVGIFCLIEGAMIARRRSDARGRLARVQPALILCLGVMLAPDSAARLRDWTGSGMTAMTVLSLAASVTVIALSARALSRRDAVPTQDEA